MMHFIVNLYQCSEHWTVDVMSTTHLMEIALYVHLKSCKIHVLRAQIWSIKDESNYNFFFLSFSINYKTRCEWEKYERFTLHLLTNLQISQINLVKNCNYL